MKASKLTYLLAVSLAFTFVATGCKKKPTPLTDLPGRVARPPSDLPPGGSVPPVGEDPNAVGNPLPRGFENIDRDYNQNREKLAAHMVHFAYDSTAIRSSEQAHVQAVAAYLKSAPANEAVLVEGHCDERGTEEYNRALGERRALALREALIAQGADGQRITTRSFGKDRKIDTGASEAAHARNRRGEFVVLTPK